MDISSQFNSSPKTQAHKLNSHHCEGVRLYFEAVAVPDSIDLFT